METEHSTEPVTPGVLYGIAGVGIHIFGHRDGVLVSQWLKRYAGYPAPAFTELPGRGGIPVGLWYPSQAPEWLAWRAAFPGRGNPGVPKPRSGNRAGRSVAARSSPAVISRVLDGYELCAPVPAGTRLRPAIAAAGGRLTVTGTGGDRIAWARDRADADTASTAVPALIFGPRP